MIKNVYEKEFFNIFTNFDVFLGHNKLNCISSGIGTYLSQCISDTSRHFFYLFVNLIYLKKFRMWVSIRNKKPIGRTSGEESYHSLRLIDAKDMFF
jgi:hypothetical protein